MIKAQCAEDAKDQESTLDKIANYEDCPLCRGKGCKNCDSSGSILIFSN